MGRWSITPRTFSPEARERIKQAAIRRGEREAKGTRVCSNGYIEYTRGPNKGRLAHRVIMEGIIGRLLLPSEEVDHIDLNRANNDPTNLILRASKADHMRAHRQADKHLYQRDERTGRYTGKAANDGARS